MSEYKYALLACDGSAALGQAGYGIHGFYANPTENIVPGPPSNIVTTDGYITRKSITDDTVHLLPEYYLDIYGTVAKSRTSNEAEIDAVISLLTYVLEVQSADRVRVYSDSQYVVTGYNQYIEGWSANKWLNEAGKKRPNYRQWERLLSLKERVDATEIDFTVEWCKAHNGFIMNERADVLAGAGTNIESGEVIKRNQDVKTYWKSTPDRSPLLSFKHLYFLANKDYHTPGEYHMGEPIKDPYNLGKKTNQCGYGAVILKEPNHHIETVINTTIEKSGGVTIPLCTLYTDKVFNPVLYGTLTDLGGLALRQPNVLSRSLNFVKDRVSVVTEYQDLNMLMRGIAIINDLLRTLKIFLGDEDKKKTDNHTIEDITRYFSETNDKGKVVALSALKESAAAYKLPSEANSKKMSTYLMNSDLPNRFRLVRLANAGATFYIVTFKEGGLGPIRNAFIIQDTTGAGIYSSWYPAMAL